MSDQANQSNPVTNLTNQVNKLLGQVKDRRTLSAGEIFWFFLVALIVFLIFVFIFQFSWNHSVTPIFGWKAVTFVQALLLLIVAKMLLPGCSFTTLL